MAVCFAGNLAHAEDTALAYAAAARTAQTIAPDVYSGRARAEVAAAGVGVARIVANPVATVGTTTEGGRFFSSFTVPLPITGRASMIRAAESSSEAAASELPLLRLDARFGAASTWCDLWLAERTLDVARENEQRAAKVLAAAEQRFREGTAPRLDAVRAKAEHARSRAEMIARTELVGESSAALAYWLGRDPALVLHVAGTPPEAAPLPPVSALLARLESHPLAARSLARSRVAAAQVDVQKSKAWPTFGVQLGATLLDRQAPENNLSAGLVFGVPIFSWNHPAVAQAESGVVQVAADSNMAASRLRADLVSAYAALKAASARADAAEKEVLPAAQDAADLTADAYLTGSIDLAAVLIAEKALADAKQAAFDSVAQRGRALAALEHAVGGSL